MRLTINRTIARDLHDEIRELIREGFRGVYDTGVEVHVKGSGENGFSGYAYDGIPSVAKVAKNSRELVTIRMPRDPRIHTGYPCTYKPGYKYAPAVTFTSWQDRLVYIAAHEARHLHQYRHYKPRSEVACARHAKRVLERWQPPTPDAIARVAQSLLELEQRLRLGMDPAHTAG